MEKNGVKKLAGVLKVLVTVTFVCNLLALPLVPGVVSIGLEGGLRAFAELTPYENPLELPVRGVIAFFLVCWQALPRVWRESYGAVLTVFLWACGTCTAVMLWQGRRVLDTILAGEPFRRSNAGNMKRAAVCCLIIAAAALVRLIFELIRHGSPLPLFTYNALFIPIFTMGSLLCMVMSALFRQAADLKEENDLTI